MGCKAAGTSLLGSRAAPLLAVLGVGLLVSLPQLATAPLRYFDALGYFCYLPAAFEGHPFQLDDLKELELERCHVKAPWRSWPATGRVVNPWGVGPALGWLPWYAGARLLYPTAPADSPPFWRACAIGTVAISLAGLAFLYLALASRLPRWPAAGGAAACVLCTPIYAYVGLVPYYSHHFNFALCSLLLWLLLTRPLGQGRAWLAMGLVVGLLASSRPQLCLLALVPWLAGRPRPAHLALAAGGCLVGFFPQMLYWRMTFGQWLVNPQAELWQGFFHVPAVWQVLFSLRRGILLWHPLLWVALAGLVWGWRRGKLPAGLVVGSLIVLGLETVLNSAAADWWGGWGFGPRRFSGLMPLLAAGMGVALARLPWLVIALTGAAWWNAALCWGWWQTGGRLYWATLARYTILHYPLYPVAAVSVAVVAAVTLLALRGSRAGEDVSGETPVPVADKQG